MNEEAVLHYFGGWGYAEIIRITLCLGKIPFRQVFLKKREEYLKLVEDGKLYFGQLPLLEMDGLNLVQHNATVRYVAEKGNLIPDDPKQRYKMNMLFDGIRSCYAPMDWNIFKKTFEDMKEEIQKSFRKYFPIFNKVHTHGHTAVTNDLLFPYPESKHTRYHLWAPMVAYGPEELESSSSGYLVGSRVTMADAALLELLLAAVDYFGDSVLENYPYLQKFLAVMKSKSEVAEYIANVRQKRTSEQLHDARTVLSHLFD